MNDFDAFARALPEHQTDQGFRGAFADLLEEEGRIEEATDLRGDRRVMIYRGKVWVEPDVEIHRDGTCMLNFRGTRLQPILAKVPTYGEYEFAGHIHLRTFGESQIFHPLGAIVAHWRDHWLTGAERQIDVCFSNPVRRRWTYQSPELPSFTAVRRLGEFFAAIGHDEEAERCRQVAASIAMAVANGTGRSEFDRINALLDRIRETALPPEMIGETSLRTGEAGDHGLPPIDWAVLPDPDQPTDPTLPDRTS